MITIVDKENGAWGGMDLTRNGYIIYDDGTSKKIETKDVIFDHGQFSGELLSEVSDYRFLKWMEKRGVDNGDYFLKNCAMLRLLELN
jgi:hypothetical protein